MSGLIEVMQHDMRIFPYRGETIEYYTGRLMYSALAHWIRFAVLDEITENYKYKSKSYLYRRGCEILENMVACIPESRSWIGGSVDNNVNPVHEMREKMFTAGELMEVDEHGNVGLPVYQQVECVQGCYRIKGLLYGRNSEEFLGITRVIRMRKATNKAAIFKAFAVDDYINWLYERARWEACSEIDQYEFFNVISKNAPYKSWADSPIRSKEYHLGRMALLNGLYEYYIFRYSSGKWFVSSVSTIASEYKEERRIILGLRKKYNNQMIAYYSYVGSVIILHLNCRLPLKEEGLIETYCWPLKGFNDKLNYVVPFLIWDDLKILIEENLGIFLQEIN